METFKQVFEGCNMGRLRIILLKYLSREKEEVEKHGIGDELRNLEKGLILDLYFGCGYLSDDLKNDDDDGRP